MRVRRAAAEGGDNVSCTRRMVKNERETQSVSNASGKFKLTLADFVLLYSNHCRSTLPRLPLYNNASKMANTQDRTIIGDGEFNHLGSRSRAVRTERTHFEQWRRLQQRKHSCHTTVSPSPVSSGFSLLTLDIGIVITGGTYHNVSIHATNVLVTGGTWVLETHLEGN